MFKRGSPSCASTNVSEDSRRSGSHQGLLRNIVPKRTWKVDTELVLSNSIDLDVQFLVRTEMGDTDETSIFSVGLIPS